MPPNSRIDNKGKGQSPFRLSPPKQSPKLRLRLKRLEPEKEVQELPEKFKLSPPPVSPLLAPRKPKEDKDKAPFKLTPPTMTPKLRLRSPQPEPTPAAPPKYESPFPYAADYQDESEPVPEAEWSPDDIDWMTPLKTGMLADGFFDELHPVVDDEWTAILESYLNGEEIAFKIPDEIADYWAMIDMLNKEELAAVNPAVQKLERLIKVSESIRNKTLDRGLLETAIPFALDAGLPLTLVLGAALPSYWVSSMLRDRDDFMARYHGGVRLLIPTLCSVFATQARQGGASDIAVFYDVLETIGTLNRISQMEDREEREEVFGQLERIHYRRVLRKLNRFSEEKYAESFAKVRDRLVRMVMHFRRRFIEMPPTAGTVDIPSEGELKKIDRPSKIMVDPSYLEPDEEAQPVELDTRIIHALSSDEWNYFAASDEAQILVNRVVENWRAVALAKNGQEEETLKEIPTIIIDLGSYWNDRKSMMLAGERGEIARDYAEVFAKAWGHMLSDDADSKRLSAKRIDETALTLYARNLATAEPEEFAVISAFHAVARAFLLLSASADKDVLDAWDCVKFAKKLLRKQSLPTEIYKLMDWLDESVEMEVKKIESAAPAEEQGEAVSKSEAEPAQMLRPGQVSGAYEAYKVVGRMPSLNKVVSRRVSNNEMERVIREFNEEVIKPISEEAWWCFEGIMSERGKGIEYERMLIEDEVCVHLEEEDLNKKILYLWAISRVVRELPRKGAFYTTDQHKVWRIIRIFSHLGWELTTETGPVSALDKENTILDKWMDKYEPNLWGELDFAERYGLDRGEVQRIIEAALSKKGGGGNAPKGSGGTADGATDGTTDSKAVDNGAAKQGVSERNIVTRLRVGLGQVLGMGGRFQNVAPATLIGGMRLAGLRV